MRVRKGLGGDQEFGNALLGTGTRGDTTLAAALLLLSEFEGFPKHSTGCIWLPSECGVITRLNHDTTVEEIANSQDWGRTWLPSGSSAYMDMGHIEFAIAEEHSARGYVAGVRAMYRMVGQAAVRASARLEPGRRVVVFADNSDRLGNISYGAHLNVTLSMRTWNSIMQRNLIQLALLIAYQISSVVITGAGKAGAENGAPPAWYQCSARADFLESVLPAERTTHARPLVNCRNEPLAGNGLARYHCISFDANLCPHANYLKAGGMAIVLSCLESGWSDPRLIVEDPLTALAAFSRDPFLSARARMADGKRLTAVEIQSAFLEAALKIDFRDYVPDADHILELWGECLEHLRKKDWDILARRLDWVLKWQILEKARSRRGLDWADAELRHLDRAYANLDPGEGLFLNCERAGLVDPIVSEEEIKDRMVNPPRETRAYARGRLLQLAGDRVATVDWDRIRIWTDSGLRTVELSDLFSHTQAQIDPLLRTARSQDDLLDGLDEISKNTNLNGGRHETTTALFQ